MTFRTRLARIGYVLGTGLVVTAIVYFFSSHWGGLARGLQTLLAACLTAGFYALAFVPARLAMWRKHGDLLPLVFLFAGTVAFGATTALLDYIYNVHGEPWRIMAIWFVPALLFALLLRNVWFYALAYVIGHLALWFCFFSPLYHVDYTDWQQAGIMALFGFINLLLFFAAESGRWQAGFVKQAALAVILFVAVWLSNGFILNDVGRWLNVAAIAVLVIAFFAFGRRRDTFALSMTALASSFYAVLKFLELMEAYYSEWFFLFGLLFVALLLTGNVLFFRYVARLNRDGGKSEETENTGKTEQDEITEQTGVQPGSGPTETGTQLPPPSPAAATNGNTAARVVSTIVTVVGTAIGTASLIGLISLVGSAWNEPELVMFAASCLLVFVMIILPKLNTTVRNTVMLIGLLVGNISTVIYDEIWSTVLVFALGIAVWIGLRGYVPRLFAHFVLNGSVGIMCLQHFNWYGNDFTWTLVLLAALNGLVYGLHHWAGPAFRRPLKNGGLVFMLALLFWLTFLDDVFPGSHSFFNLLYFVLVSALLVLSVRRKHNRETTLLMVFWFVFVAFKYYDWLWNLMHKSLTLLVAGFVLVLASAWLDRRTDGASDIRPRELLPYRHLLIIVLMIALQFVYIGGEAIARERMLAGGTTVKLALAPDHPLHVDLDNRVYLQYAISYLPERTARALQKDGMRGGERIRIVLRPDERGVYKYDRLHAEGEQLAATEIIINGRYDGWRWVRYGIESHYVGEVDEAMLDGMRYALVRIGTNGNALVLELARE